MSSLLVEADPCPGGPVGGISTIYTPLEPLSDFNGEDPFGTWTLSVFDYYNSGTDPEGLLDCFLFEELLCSHEYSSS